MSQRAAHRDIPWAQPCVLLVSLLSLFASNSLGSGRFTRASRSSVRICSLGLGRGEDGGRVAIVGTKIIAAIFLKSNTPTHWYLCGTAGSNFVEFVWRSRARRLRLSARLLAQFEFLGFVVGSYCQRRTAREAR